MRVHERGHYMFNCGDCPFVTEGILDLMHMIDIAKLHQAWHESTYPTIRN